MPGAILTLFNGMVASSLVGETAFPGIVHLFGEENINAGGDPPRVVWVPTETTFGAPGPNYRGDGINSPRMIWQGREIIEAHLWAGAAEADPPEKHADAVETLRQAVLQALHAQMWSGYQYRAVRGAWVKAQGELSRRGRSYVLFIEAVVPVTNPADTEAQVLTIPITPVVTPYGGQ